MLFYLLLFLTSLAISILVFCAIKFYRDLEKEVETLKIDCENIKY